MVVQDASSKGALPRPMADGVATDHKSAKERRRADHTNVVTARSPMAAPPRPVRRGEKIEKSDGLLLTVRAAMPHNVRVTRPGVVGNHRHEVGDASSDPRA